MPRRSSAKVTGVWEKVPGSRIWWIRYRENGALHREKVGRKSDALALYQKRKSEIRAGAKLPENMRRASIRFGQLAEDIRGYSEKHHRDRGHIESRLEADLPDFEIRLADQIKPEDIDGWIARNTDTAATANRYRALFSLIFREALRNGKVTGNPARLVRLRHKEQRTHSASSPTTRRNASARPSQSSSPNTCRNFPSHSRNRDEVVGTILSDLGANRFCEEGNQSGANQEQVGTNDSDE